jgi:hypothetical protein
MSYSTNSSVVVPNSSGAPTFTSTTVSYANATVATTSLITTGYSQTNVINTGSIYSLSTHSNLSANAITVTDGKNTLLSITRDGEVTWSGKLSLGVDQFIKLIENHIDSKSSTASMRRRTYTRAMRSILHRINKLQDKQQIIQALEAMIENRECHDLEHILNDE